MKYLRYREQIKNNHGNVLPQKEQIREIGMLQSRTKTVKFISDHNWIFANGKAILPTYNDQETASRVFGEAMQMFYSDKFLLY